MYRQLSTEQLTALLKRYVESEKRLEDRGAMVKLDARRDQDRYLGTVSRILIMIEAELLKRFFE